MKTIEIVGYARHTFGKKHSIALRHQGNVPCVLYGGKEQIHFHAPMALCKPLIYTPDAYFVTLNIEGKTYRCIMKEAQLHPISDMLWHIDFYQFNEAKKLTMQLPVVCTGTSPGVREGGLLTIKQRKLAVTAYPKDLPDVVKVDISQLGLGQNIKVKELAHDIKNPNSVVVAVEIPRALRSKAGEEAATDAAAESK